MCPNSFGALFDARHLEAGIALQGQLDHADAVGIRRVAGGFMRRPGGRNEEHAIQLEAAGGGAGRRQVAVVNRIEGAAEEGQAGGGTAGHGQHDRSLTVAAL